MIFDWKAEPTAVPMDHGLVSLKFTLKDAPLIRSSHWTWYIPSLDEKPLISEIVEKGKELQEKLGFVMGNPWVGNSHTAPVTRNTVPATGTGTHHTH